MHLLDTFAWVEVLTKTERGRRVAELTRRTPHTTAILTLAEIASWALRQGFDPAPALEKIESTSQVLPLTRQAAVLAGRLREQYRAETPTWGMVDTMIYATALVSAQELVTGDPHFQGKPHVILI